MTTSLNELLRDLLIRRTNIVYSISSHSDLTELASVHVSIQAVEAVIQSGNKEPDAIDEPCLHVW